MVTSLAALLLVDAGELDIHAPVARYWPEFAAAGKQDVLVRHLLSHTSGVSGLEHPTRLADLYDVRATADRLAAQAPWWRPGSASGYHVLTYGHLVGELVHRLTGLSLREFVREQIAGPLAADFRIGLPDNDFARVADVIVPPLDFDTEALGPDTVAYRTLTGPSFDAAADLGAANGHGNAEALIDILAPLARGGDHAGGRLLRPDTIDLIFDQQSCGADLVNGLHLRWGIGYALPDPRTAEWIPDGRIAFWGGWGGSMVIADLDRRTTIAYVMNNMGPDLLGSPRAAAYTTAVYRALGAGART